MEFPLSSLGDYAFLSYDGSNSCTAAPESTELKVLSSASWTHCGSFLSLYEANLPESYQNWKQATIQGNLSSQLFPLLSFAHDFIAKAGLSHYWLSIRATKAVDEKSSHRWHTDDSFFSQDDKSHNIDTFRPVWPNLVSTDERPSASNSTEARTEWKLLTTLLGPGTLFVKDGVAARAIQRNFKNFGQNREEHRPCSSVQCRTCYEVTENVGRLLGNALAGFEIEKARKGQCVFIRTGDAEGAMHSIPPFFEDRIFVNIIPGTEEELRRLTKKYGMEYPRAWTLGVPVRHSWEPFKREVKSREADSAVASSPLSY